MAVALYCMLSSCSDDDPLKDGGNVRLKSMITPGDYNEWGTQSPYSWEIDYNNQWEINTIYRFGNKCGHARYVGNKIYLTIMASEETATLTLTNGKVTKVEINDVESDEPRVITVSYDNQGRVSEVKKGNDISYSYAWGKNDLLQRMTYRRIREIFDDGSYTFDQTEYAFEYSNEYSDRTINPVCIDVLNRYTISGGDNWDIWWYSLFLAPKSFGDMPSKLISKVRAYCLGSPDYNEDISIGDIDADGCVHQYRYGSRKTTFEWEKKK